MVYILTACIFMFTISMRNVILTGWSWGFGGFLVSKAGGFLGLKRGGGGFLVSAGGSHIFTAYIWMADTGIVYILIAFILMAYILMAYISMAYVLMP
jgi:hypothetical protein